MKPSAPIPATVTTTAVAVVADHQIILPPMSRKPSRSELIDAIATVIYRRRKGEYDSRYKALQKEQEEHKKKLRRFLPAILKRNSITIGFNGWADGWRIDLGDFDNKAEGVPPKALEIIAKMQAVAAEFRKLQEPYFERIKANLKKAEAEAAEDRVATLASDPVVSATLAKIGESMMADVAAEAAKPGAGRFKIVAVS